MMKKVVLLVDNKHRDLPGAVLIAHHLESLGIECHLQPLEAWRGCLYAFKPDMIIFNHLLGSHLVKYSQELHKMGILVGVLPNEGILYNEEVLEFNASKYHNDAHIDVFFCWNNVHKEALQKALNGTETQVVTVGVPRFDFYFEPLKNSSRASDNTLLICTNFVFAQFLEKDKSIGDGLFAPWKDRIPSYKNYWEIIRVNHDSRAKFLLFLQEIADSFSGNIILKPHPGEDKNFYSEWLSNQTEEVRNKIEYNTTDYVWDLIPKCAVEIACETCTTTLESWISGKPTIELLLNKHPVFYKEFITKMTDSCDDPKNIIQLIDRLIKNPSQECFATMREEHLAKWCDSPCGKSSYKMAKIIRDLLERSKEKNVVFDFSHMRKGIKLSVLNFFDLPYNYDPLLALKLSINPNKYREKVRVYRKTIKPSDIRFWKQKISALLGK